jgi:squalene-hopene/tetraprenyl-beta-curcumene cyclase
MKTKLLVIVLVFGVARAGAWSAEPAINLKAPAPNRPDEPMAAKFSLSRAAEYMDGESLHWTRQRQCGSCHTNYPYLMARPTMKEPSPALAEVRRFFEDRAAHWDTKKPRWDAEVVATASTLAFVDGATTGKLQPATRQALDRMWTLQRPDGSWNWLKCNWAPAEADDHYGVLFAALGVGAAPDKYAETPAARAGLAKMQAFLKANPLPNLHHRTMLLWAACRLPGLMPAPTREATVKELLALQRADGGWNLPSLGDWKRHSGEPNDKANAPSDGYATGLVVYVLRQTGLPKDHPACRKGADWLRTHQRQSGRWFTRSLNNDEHHYIAHAGTAYAVMALRACDEP